MIICVVIVIAIYQAMCSSDDRHNKAENEKYAPVETEIYESSSGLELAEREDDRR